MSRFRLLLCVLLMVIFPASALERPEVTFKIFQFPADMIPRIDGNADDWNMVPNSYAIGMDQLEDTEVPGGHGTDRDPKDLDVKVKVGWVKGLNRVVPVPAAWDRAGADRATAGAGFAGGERGHGGGGAGLRGRRTLRCAEWLLGGDGGHRRRVRRGGVGDYEYGRPD